MAQVLLEYLHFFVAVRLVGVGLHHAVLAVADAALTLELRITRLAVQSRELRLELNVVCEAENVLFHVRQKADEFAAPFSSICR